MKTVGDALRFREVPTHSTLDLKRQFGGGDSVTALLRRTGPFMLPRDGYGFDNSWPLTDSDMAIVRQHYQPLVDGVTVAGIEIVRHALEALTFSNPVPLAPRLSLPAVAVEFVVGRIAGDLRNTVFDLVGGQIPGHYGRCGGAAFSGLDFFLTGWPVSGFTDGEAHAGPLRDYIFTRLLDSLDANGPTFLWYVMVLSVLPRISTLASGALGAAVGSVVGGPVGAALGAFLAGREDVLGLGGARALKDPAQEQWRRLHERLRHDAAWPVGLVYGDSANPIDQHQIVATRSEDLGNGKARLTIWDNNLHGLSAPAPWRMVLDFTGSELTVSSELSSLTDLKALICEDYSPRTPPATLRR